MALSPESPHLNIEEPAILAYHKQADFAAFLVNEYFIKPSKQLEEARQDDTNGLLPLVSLDCLLPSGDIDKIVGHICEETHLIEERHIQQRKPFRILEKPLLIPAMLAALLHRILFEKAGVFISSTTFDLWASTALGFPARTSRLWLDACAKVEEALEESSVKQLLRKRSASDTGIHAIKRQADSKGALFSLWCSACSMLCASLTSPLLSMETCQEHFTQAVGRSISFRKDIESKTSSVMYGRGAPGFNIHAAGEPELCSCLVFHSFFRQLETLFHRAIDSKVKMNVSAHISFAVFVGCLNAFTYYRYSANKAGSMCRLLDTVAHVADGKSLTHQFDLKSVEVRQLSRYVQRASVLSSDEVFSGISHRRARKESWASSASILPRFSEMNYSTIRMTEIYPFSMVAAMGPELDDMGGCSVSTDVRVHPEDEDDENFVEMTTIYLDESGDERCTQYILSAEEAASKRQVQEKLYGGKQGQKS
ncbi:conserved hypothetical protein [Leishmania infantum JPCM5]|uniref:Uncharacterized protein n=2 Tax=Leishmania infantum TaxID=5671 RepID=A4I3F2_LEIIN|nr:conserved hypothetical protein [Leishmania infantum JPCM5]CAC9502383.1 hypothetical_protein_-_conserved [Leishmania infantum]CAM69306.1 conserved hypothetical protein [Leishmania infantum JPCM5]SUZ43242.1 hypothetical_protein_-_conserved [Leishmania infantum]|eukprot:XP_001470114.1 conserved hypothetical protein [Leishmania infantum JPCM5]